MKTRVLLLTMGLIGLAFLNLSMFRTDYPKICFLTLTGSVVLLFEFPYKKFLKCK